MSFFFFNDTATTEIYTLSLHDALPISGLPARRACPVSWLHRGQRLVPRAADPGGIPRAGDGDPGLTESGGNIDRKSTRLNSSHANISYAVFCLKKKKKYTHLFHNPVNS